MKRKIKKVLYHIDRIYDEFYHRGKRKKDLICLVCNNKFTTAALVFLYSLQKNNPSVIDMDIKIYFDPEISPLSTENRKKLHAINPSIEFVSITNHIYREAQCVQESHKAAYLKIELFKETQYDRVFFFDVDMICLSDIQPLFNINKGFSAAMTATADGSRLSINTGMLVVGKRYINMRIYSDLQKMIQDSNREVQRQLDQRILNIYLRGKKRFVNILDDRYNYRKWSHENNNQFNEDRERIGILHYSGYQSRPKPWDIDETSNIAAYSVWHEYNREMVNLHPETANN